MTTITKNRLPDDFKEKVGWTGYFEKAVTNNLILGVTLYRAEKFIYISKPQTDSIDSQCSWREFTEEKLSELHLLFTGQHLVYKDCLDLEAENKKIVNLHNELIDDMNKIQVINLRLSSEVESLKKEQVQTEGYVSRLQQESTDLRNNIKRLMLNTSIAVDEMISQPKEQK